MYARLCVAPFCVPSSPGIFPRGDVVNKEEWGRSPPFLLNFLPGFRSLAEQYMVTSCEIKADEGTRNLRTHQRVSTTTPPNTCDGRHCLFLVRQFKLLPPSLPLALFSLSLLPTRIRRHATTHTHTNVNTGWQEESISGVHDDEPHFFEKPLHLLYRGRVQPERRSRGPHPCWQAQPRRPGGFRAAEQDGGDGG